MDGTGSVFLKFGYSKNPESGSETLPVTTIFLLWKRRNEQNMNLRPVLRIRNIWYGSSRAVDPDLHGSRREKLSQKKWKIENG